MRGRNRGKNHNPLTKVYESNGPDVKIRGTASHVAEKYIQLARDAQSSGDPVGAENYYQHAEHYFRMIAAAQEQFRQNAPFYGNGNRPEGGNDMREGSAGNDMREGTGNDMRDGAGGYDDDGDDDGAPMGGDQQPQFGTRDPQPHIPRDAQFYGEQPQQQQPRQHNNNNNNNHNNNQNAPNGDDNNVGGLPSFITGGGAQQGGQGPQQAQGGNDPNNGGSERYQEDRGGDRYGYRRRRHRRGGGGGGGPRPEHNGMRHDNDDQH
jgi:hypothetical protein